MSRLLIVSNRSPVTVRVDGGEVHIDPSTGGLATGLRGPHQRSQGLWIGWPGDMDALDAPQRSLVERRLEELRVVPVVLSAEEVRGYYEGVSNEVLWPFFHSLVGLVPLELPEFAVYRQVNQRFADVAVSRYRAGDTIWVHDYQLMLVPALIRQQLPDAPIGFFLHIPFPPVAVFRGLPYREELLAGLLGADLVGFHAPSYMRHFAAAATRVLGVPSGLEGVSWRDRPVRLGVFPMGIDAAAFAARAREPDTVERAAELRQSGRMQILIGIDRLDYTKGIPRRLLAYERLLRDHPELREQVQLIQIAVPSRTGVEAYQELRGQVEGLVGRINGAFSTASWTAVQYLLRSIAPGELVTLYLAADAMLVTPLRDGMNLVAKEFVAARADEGGVLVLSEFTGAAAELAEALHVNPYDVEATADAYHRALTMAAAERTRRMRALRRRVSVYDVHRWVHVFLGELKAGVSNRREQPPLESPPEVLESVLRRVRETSHVALLLDYDGTLVPFAPAPDLALPDDELLALLRRLAGHPGFEVHVVSGRSRETLEAWLGDLPLGLHAEHGAWSRPAGEPEWRALETPPMSWREGVRAILDDFAARTPGTIVEEKTFGLAWHYRMADPDYGTSQANELKLHLTMLLANEPVQVLHGQKVVEVRPHAFHKGRVVEAVAGGVEEGSLIVAMGDDRTDEDLFAALPPASIAIHVGPAPGSPAIRLKDVAAVRRFLAALAQGRARAA